MLSHHMNNHISMNKEISVLKKTHMSIGLAAGTLSGLFILSNPYITFINFIAVMFSSTLPDIDIDLGIKHRGLTHSVLFGVILSVIIFNIYPPLIRPFIIGFGLHILADSFTNTGVQLLYPIESKISVRLFNTKDPIENVIQSVCYSIVVISIFFYVYNSTRASMSYF